MPRRPHLQGRRSRAPRLEVGVPEPLQQLFAADPRQELLEQRPRVLSQHAHAEKVWEVARVEARVAVTAVVFFLSEQITR
jgi:hypothetical protein